MATKTQRKKNPQQLHAAEECDCFDLEIAQREKRCTYRVFPDGWSFFADAGNSKSRGEVFTPLFIVEKMIVDSGMLPAAVVWGEHLNNVSAEEAAALVRVRVNEPAVGTGNYSSTILWHKLRLAERVAQAETGALNKDVYEVELLTAVASLYAFDVDAGNLETVKHRLLSRDYSLDSSKPREFWTDYLLDKVNEQLPESDHLKQSLVEGHVNESLAKAQDHWGDSVAAGGAVNKAYRAATGEELPTDLHTKLVEILDANLLLFNGISEEATVKPGFYAPGWKNIVWRWWSVSSSGELSSKSVLLAEQITTGRIALLEKKLARLKSEGTRPDPNPLAIVSIPQWVDPKLEKEHKEGEKELSHLKKALKELKSETAA